MPRSFLPTLVLVAAAVVAAAAAASCPPSALPPSPAPYTRHDTPDLAPVAMAAFDANNDGTPDLVVGGRSSATLSITYGSGTVADPLLARTLISSGITNMAALDHADLDGDGWRDIVVGADSTLRIFHNANGTYASTPTASLGALASPIIAVRAADLDSAGDLDVVVACSGHLYIVAAPYTVIPIPLLTTTVTGVDVGDVNKDGLVDLVATLSAVTNVYINSGIGPFTPTTITTSADVTTPDRPTVVDVNGDGRLDVVVRASASDLILLLAKATGPIGVFDAPVDLPPTASPVAAYVIAPFATSSSSLPTLASVSNDGSVLVYDNPGTGLFDLPAVVIASTPFNTPLAIVAADYDSDGAPDIAVSYDSPDAIVFFTSSDRTSLAAAGAELIPSGLDGTVSVAFAHLTDDDYIDVLTAQSSGSGSQLAIRPGTASPLTFLPATLIHTAPNSDPAFTYATPADLDRNGATDVVLCTQASVDIIRNFGGGVFSSPINIFSEGANHAVVADINKDFFLDVVIGTFGSPTVGINVLFGDASGFAFEGLIHLTPGDASLVSFVLVDANGDHKFDIVSAWSSGSPPSPTPPRILYYQFLDPAFASALSIAPPPTPNPFVSVATADLNSDDAPDIVALDTVPTIRVYPSVGAGVWGPTPDVVTTPVMGSLLLARLVVTDLNHDGVLDFVVAAPTTTVMYSKGGYPPVLRTKTVEYAPPSAVGALFHDVSRDGIRDLIVFTSNKVHFVRSDGLVHAMANVAASHDRAVRPEGHPACASGLNGGFSVQCITALLADSSPCTVDTLRLPSRTYSGCTLDSAPATPIPRAVTVAGAASSIKCDPPYTRTWTWSAPGAAAMQTATFSDFFLSDAAPDGFVVASPFATLVIHDAVVSGVSTSRGPLFATGGGRIVLSSSIGESSSAPTGAIVHVDEHSHGVVVGCTFSSNSATVQGGVVFGAFNSTLTIANSTFTSNSAPSGGAISALLPASLSITHSTFTANVADGPNGGGAISLYANGSTVDITHTHSSASAAVADGAFALIAVDPRAPSSITITHHTATGDVAGGLGGWLHVFTPPGTGAPPVPATTLTISHSTTASCIGVRGGGSISLATIGTDVVLSDLTLDSSQAMFGGGIYCAHQAYVPPITPFARYVLPPLLSSPPPTPVTITNVAITATTADVGGGVFECGCDLTGSLTVDGALAAAAGGAGFACAGTAASFGAVGPGGGGASSVGASGYGPGWATPPESVAWPTDPPPAVSSGNSLGSAVAELRDAFGQTVREAGLVISLSVEANGTVGILGSTVVAPTTSGAIGVGSTRIALATPYAAVSAAIHLAILDSPRPPFGPADARSVMLTVCGPGEGGVVETDGSLVCTPCADVDFSPVLSADPCLRRPLCPDSTTAAAVNASAPTTCICKAGFWSFPGREPTGACALCPRGAVCEAGIAPYPLPGFYPTPVGSFVACLRPSACVGGRGNPCAVGYVGYMCNACADGFYSDAQRRCTACPATASSGFAGAIVALVTVGLVVAAALAWSLVRAGVATGAATGESKSTAELIRAFRRQSAPASPSIVLVSLQLIGVIADANLGWSSSTRTVLNSANIANIDANLFASECALANFHTKYAISLVLPLAFLAVVFLGLVVGKLVIAPLSPRTAHLSTISVRALFDAVLFSVAPLVYVPLARSSLILFDCVKLPNGDLVLDIDPGVACLDSDWWSVVPLGAVVVAAYLLGLPLYFAVSLFSRRAHLFEPAVTQRYGALYRTLRRGFYWFEVANIGKRLVLVATAVFLSLRQLALIFTMLAVLVSAFAFSIRVSPYYFPGLNTLDQRLNALLLALLIIGTGAYAERSSNSSDTFFVVAAVLLLLAIVAVSVWGVASEVRLIYRERHDLYLAAADRSSRLMGVITTELLDVEAGPDLLHSAGLFLANLGVAARAGREPGSCSADAGDVALDDM